LQAAKNARCTIIELSNSLLHFGMVMADRNGPIDLAGMEVGLSWSVDSLTPVLCASMNGGRNIWMDRVLRDIERQFDRIDGQD
jgi:hypothetical protein